MIGFVVIKLIVLIQYGEHAARIELRDLSLFFILAAIALLADVILYRYDLWRAKRS